MYYCLLLCILVFSCQTKEKTERPPNVVLIMVDDMGVEALSSYGNLTNHTPHIDQMISRGILFNNCISQPLCTPSRVKIMTGQYNYRNYEYFGYLNTHQRTFGHLFQENGYRTGIAGKWQLNGLAYPDEISDWKDSSRPQALGFDEYCLWQLTLPRRDGERYAQPLIEQNGDTLSTDLDDYGPDIFSDFVLDFIERHQDTSFFVYYPMVLVHDPFVPTPDSEAWKEPSRRYENDTAYFKDMVEYTDKIVGQINAKLITLGLSDNTLVIFTADNGTHFSIYSQTENGKIQGGKGNTTNGGTHVPLVVTWEDKIKQPATHDGLISFSDFYATFSDILGVADVKDGRSFLPVLEGQQSPPTRETLFIHYDPRWGQRVNQYRNQFVRTEQYKLYPDGKFYDLEKDWLEENPLTDDILSEKEQQLKRQLSQELAEHPKWEKE